MSFVRAELKKRIEICGWLHIDAVHGEEIVTFLHIHAGLGERRTQRWRPVEAAIDLGETVSTVSHGVVRAKQAAWDVARIAEAVAAAAAMMADVELAHHPLDDALDIGFRRSIGEERLVFLLVRNPVHAVHARRVEIIAIDAPRFVEDLFPFRARIDLHLNIRGREAELAGCGCWARRCDGPRALQRIEHLLSVSGDFVLADVREKRILLALGEIVAVQHAVAIGTPHEVEHSRFAGLEIGEVGRRNRQGDDALLDPVEVDARQRRCCSGPRAGRA